MEQFSRERRTVTARFISIAIRSPPPAIPRPRAPLDMEPETMDGVVDAAQYPVDAVTADAMTTDVGPKGLGMSLDDLVRESKPAGGGRGGRGHKGEGGRLKVRAVIVKRPAGGGRGFGGRGPAPPRKTVRSMAFIVRASDRSNVRAFVVRSFVRSFVRA